MSCIAKVLVRPCAQSVLVTVVGDIDVFAERVPISKIGLSGILSAKHLTKWLSCWFFGYPNSAYIVQFGQTSEFKLPTIGISEGFVSRATGWRVSVAWSGILGERRKN